MRLSELALGAATGTDALLQEELRKKRLEEEQSALPASWGADRVSISPEARAALASAEKTTACATERQRAMAAEASEAVENIRAGAAGGQGGNEASASGSVNINEEAPLDAEFGVKDEFAAYMHSKRSKVQSGNVKEQIEALQKKLAGIDSQLVKITAGDAPQASKQGQAESLNAQRQAILDQISELSARLAEEESAAGANAAA